jgi:hypothetical protein
MITDDNDRMAAAYERGCSRGWDHANFVDAYGKEHERRGPDYPADYEDIPWGSQQFYARTFEERTAESVIRPKLRAEFKRGWTDGRRRFHRGQYPDGTKIKES